MVKNWHHRVDRRDKKIRIQNNFELSELFYDVHIFSNYLMITLIIIHLMAVVTHKLFFNDNFA